MKKFILSVIALILVLMGCGTGDLNNHLPKELSDVKIGVIQSMHHSSLDESYEGFKDVLIKEGVSEDHIEYLVAGDLSNCTTVADKLVNSGNDLILALSTPAMQAAIAATSNLPIVGCAITDYELAKIVDNNQPGRHVTGVSDLTPIKDQFKMMVDLLPDVKKVGILYCGSESNSIIQGTMAVEAADELGLEFKVYTVSESNEIQTVTEKVCNDGVDVIYIPTDNLLATYMASVEGIASVYQIPIIPGAEAMVKDGGYATYGLNYYNLGQLAGEQAVAILKGEKTAADTPIGYLDVEECQLIVNLTTAKKCGLSVNKADYPSGTEFVE